MEQQQNNFAFDPSAVGLRCSTCLQEYADYLDLSYHINKEHLSYFPWKCITCNINFPGRAIAEHFSHTTRTCRLANIPNENMEERLNQLLRESLRGTATRIMLDQRSQFLSASQPAAFTFNTPTEPSHLAQQMSSSSAPGGSGSSGVAGSERRSAVTCHVPFTFFSSTGDRQRAGTVEADKLNKPGNSVEPEQQNDYDDDDVEIIFVGESLEAKPGSQTDSNYNRQAANYYKGDQEEEEDDCMIVGEKWKSTNGSSEGGEKLKTSLTGARDRDKSKYYVTLVNTKVKLESSWGSGAGVIDDCVPGTSRVIDSFGLNNISAKQNSPKQSHRQEEWCYQKPTDGNDKLSQGYQSGCSQTSPWLVVEQNDGTNASGLPLRNTGCCTNSSVFSSPNLFESLQKQVVVPESGTKSKRRGKRTKLVVPADVGLPGTSNQNGTAFLQPNSEARENCVELKDVRRGVFYYCKMCQVPTIDQPEKHVMEMHFEETDKPLRDYAP